MEFKKELHAEQGLCFHEGAGTRVGGGKSSSVQESWQNRDVTFMPLARTQPGVLEVVRECLAHRLPRMADGGLIRTMRGQGGVAAPYCAASRHCDPCLTPH